ncbi:hypothetical protein TSUD_73160 [Trifolium subterraneum]|uniref:Uncharacterized protein n=1 Tax=Trifolium subterraneum TaxID=3900 RepID=A0A2Z6MDN9_TRISU|nr:hypothetical protein TSUD_73160 [Trifolium subterraneum]
MATSVDPLVVGRVIGDVVDMFIPSVGMIVVDIPGGTNPKRGKEILPYIGPKPPVGIHRYILVLFEQKGPIGMVEQPTSRVSFNTRYFASQLDLGLPVATVYFNSQKEPQAKRR